MFGTSCTNPTMTTTPCGRIASTRPVKFRQSSRQKKFNNIGPQNVAFIEPTHDESIGGMFHSGFFNLRGFVVHNFNEDYGVVQTPG